MTTVNCLTCRGTTSINTTNDQRRKNHLMSRASQGNNKAAATLRLSYTIVRRYTLRYERN